MPPGCRRWYLSRKTWAYPKVARSCLTVHSELVGGGLIRSAGGWSAVRSLRKAGLFQKSDERILGSGEFVQAVLTAAQEALDNRYAIAGRGIRFEDVAAVVAGLLDIAAGQLSGPTKERIIVKGRALVCHWAVQELGLSMTDVAQRLDIAVPTASVAAKRGGRIVHDEGLLFPELLNIKI